jgi:uncharacterized protein (TIGR03437 family)
VNSLWIYDPRTDHWIEGAPLPVPGGGDHCNVASAGGKLYVLGLIRVGTSFVDGNTYEYDPVRNTWQTVAVMPMPRGASGVAAIGNRIYVAGGLRGASVADFDVFDITTRQWARLPDMPTARDHLTAQAVNGRFYAITGRTGRLFNANEEYDPATNAWRSRAPIPTARGGLGSAVLNGRILVMGGEGNPASAAGTFPQNEEYDPGTDTWRSLPPMPTPRHGFYAVSLDGRVFTPGGGPRAGAFFSNVNEVFYPMPVQPPRLAGGGLRNGASFREEVAPGGIVSLLGETLSSGEQVATAFPLPEGMNGVSVRVNGNAVPLFYVGPGQINFQLPFGLATGPLRVMVTNAGSQSSELSVTASEAAPGLFTLPPGGEGQGAILIAGTGRVAGPMRDASWRPAQRGEAVEIYGTGLGRVRNPPAAGQAASGIIETIETPVVTIGGTRAEVLFSGLAPGLAGVYQVNARIATGAATGARVPLTVAVSGRTSNEVTIAVE